MEISRTQVKPGPTCHFAPAVLEGRLKSRFSEITAKEANLMKPLIPIGFVIALAALQPEPAAAETWCIRDKTAMTPSVCGFSSALDCAHAAAVGPPQSICERERWNPPAERPHTARQQQTDRQTALNFDSRSSVQT
jgi:hypothetical protein